MAQTIDLVADEPGDAPAFGGATRVISDNELSGLLAEDARNAPAAIAHRAVIRRSTQSEASAPTPHETPTQPMPPIVVASSAPSSAATEPLRWRRLALLVVPLVVLGAVLAAWWTGAL